MKIQGEKMCTVCKRPQKGFRIFHVEMNTYHAMLSVYVLLLLFTYCKGTFDLVVLCPKLPFPKGYNVSLKCTTVENSATDLNYEWAFKSEIVTGNQTSSTWAIIGKNAILDIDKLDNSTVGTYRCDAKVSNSSSQQIETTLARIGDDEYETKPCESLNLTLQITCSDGTQTPIEELALQEGDQLTLTCDVPEVTNQLLYSWTFISKTGQISPIDETKSVYIVRRVTREGSYKCTAQSGFYNGEAAMEIELDTATFTYKVRKCAKPVTATTTTEMTTTTTPAPTEKVESNVSLGVLIPVTIVLVLIFLSGIIFAVWMLDKKKWKISVAKSKEEWEHKKEEIMVHHNEKHHIDPKLIHSALSRGAAGSIRKVRDSLGSINAITSIRSASRVKSNAADMSMKSMSPVSN